MIKVGDRYKAKNGVVYTILSTCYDDTYPILGQSDVDIEGWTTSLTWTVEGKYSINGECEDDLILDSEESKESHLISRLPESHAEALSEMLVKLHKHEITDWSFRMFLAHLDE